MCIYIYICVCQVESSLHFHAPKKGQTHEVTLTSVAVCKDAAILNMMCRVCGNEALVWKGDVHRVQFLAGEKKSSQHFLLTNDLNCSVITWVSADNRSIQSNMSCQSNDRWNGLDGANLTCGSDSTITSTVMEVKDCTPNSTHPPHPSLGESLNMISNVCVDTLMSFTATNTNISSISSDITLIVVFASSCGIALLIAAIITPLAISRRGCMCIAAFYRNTSTIDTNTTRADFTSSSSNEVSEVSCNLIACTCAQGHHTRAS